MPVPSRRDVLAAGGGVLAGLAGGYVARPYLDADSVPGPAPFAWAATEWPHPDYDPARTRNPPPESAPDGDLGEQWRYDVPGHELPAVVASNGSVVVGTVATGDGHLASVDAHGGDERWQKLGGDTSGAPVAAPGDRVFARGREYDALVSRAASGGSLLWATSTDGELRPFLGGGRQYVLDRGQESVAVRALNARTGGELWTAEAPHGYFPAAAYVAVDDRVVVGTGRTVTCLDAGDGSRVWHEDVGGNAFASGPVVAGGHVYRAALQSGISALDATTGDVRWREPFDPELLDADEPQVARYYVVGAATERVLLAVERHGDGRSEQLVAFDAAAGDQLWRTDYGGGTSVSIPTIVDRTAYASIGTDQRQRLVAFDLADGAETAAWPLPTWGGAPVVADGWVFVPTYDAVVAFR